MIGFLRSLCRTLLVWLVGSIYDFRLYLGYLRYRLATIIRGPLFTATEGQCELGKKLCVFSLYQPNGIPETVYYQLGQIKALGYSLYIVSNKKISAADKARLKEMVWRIDERPNVGRDFGGYKHGVVQSLSHLEDLDRLMLSNDSILGPLFDLGNAVDEIDAQDNDFWGINENLEFGSHIASYFLVFKPAAFTHNKFLKFWKYYKEKSSRRHTIRRGEIQLSRVLRKADLKPGVLCTSARLFELLNSQPDSLSVLELLTTTLAGDQAWDIAVSVWRGENAESIGERFDPTIKRKIAQAAVQKFEQSSSLHTFALVMNRELKCPFLKRDVVMRNAIEMGTLLSGILVETDYPIANIEYEYRIKGTMTDLSMLNKLLHAGGYI